MLNDLPARKTKWIEVGKSWRELADACVMSSALRDWTSSQREQPRTAAERGGVDEKSISNLDIRNAV
ncbi:hypothetical protein CQ12_40110 [Bradyrhizobium jicamae]|uniref:Uncharacterized protein n=1 Tax=Bradyrhizobium jicamae TaxID=280332 RepID=A0A0R3LSV6_9BRAD|nr:hypothetical protein CQ12_40110 [Bradyrhizobium jicamae]